MQWIKGLIIYLHDNFKGTTEMTLNTYSTWEAQIVKVTNNGLKKTFYLEISTDLQEIQ